MTDKTKDMDRVEAINYLVYELKYTIPDAIYIVDELCHMSNYEVTGFL